MCTAGPAQGTACAKAESRNQGGRGWRLKATIYVLASTVGAAFAGAALGTIGQVIALDHRVAAGLALAVVAVAMGLFGLAKVPIGVLQCGRETPQSWINLGGIAWSMRNGLALGCGVTSRVGFWSWYLIPVASLMVADPLSGLVIYASYGAVRGLGAWGYIVAGAILRRRIAFDDLIVWVLSKQDRARDASAVQLLVLGLAALVVLG